MVNGYQVSKQRLGYNFNFNLIPVFNPGISPARATAMRHATDMGGRSTTPRSSQSAKFPLILSPNLAATPTSIVATSLWAKEPSKAERNPAITAPFHKCLISVMLDVMIFILYF